MKKGLLCVAMLLLAACGSGGGVSETQQPEVTNVTATSPTGTLTLDFTDGTHNASQARTLASTSTPMYRVIITNPTLLLDGHTFVATAPDVGPGGTMQFSLPVARGYIVEALSYITDTTTGLKTVKSYAITSGLAVTTAGASANLTFKDVGVSVAVPASVVQNTNYPMMANFSTAAGRSKTPLNSSWYLTPTQSSAIFSNMTTGISFSTLHTFRTSQLIGTKAYFQGVFTVKPGLLKSGETLKQWARFSNLSTTVVAPNGVSVPITMPK